jgi:beta-glucosidase
LWCTINEINAYVFQGYCQGVFPPTTHNVWTGAVVMRNMLDAQCILYRELKKIDSTKACQIGLVQNYLTFKSFSAHTSSAFLAQYNIAEQLPCTCLNYIFNDVIIHFLKTGELFPYNPFLKETISDAPQCYDFIGVNYYSRVLIKSQLVHAMSKKDLSLMAVPTGLGDEQLTDMPFPVSPRGFYTALLEAATLGVPIYITENGIPDRTDEKRSAHLISHMKIISEALNNGLDIRGYYYWTLVDNFEWDHAYDLSFGITAYDPVCKTYHPKKSAFTFKEIMQKNRPSTHYGPLQQTYKGK